MKMLSSMSFRLTVLYMVLFTSSVLLLSGVHYWLSVWTPLHHMRERVDAEMHDLTALHAVYGRDALVKRLEARAHEYDPHLAFHAFLAPDGTVLTANLPSWPSKHSDHWLRLEADEYADGDEVDHEPLTLDRILPDGSRLLVGRDIEHIDEIEEKLLAAVSGVLLTAIVLGLIGGMLMSRALGRRIERVTATARRVMQGDLSGRIPTRGTGDDFDRLTITLNDMLARTEKLFESVRRVSDNVAHELRTPLTRLRANLEELRATGAAAAPALIDGTIAEAESLEKTFDAVLRIARIESGRHEATAAPVDVSALLADAAELYTPVAEDRQQSVHTAIAGNLVVNGDRDLLFQSFCNLLDNASKYTPQGGRILVAAQRCGAHVEVTITDSGPGIAPEHRTHVIERFYRVPSTAGAPGAGLGLSLVAAVAERHHSTLGFEDAGPGLIVRWLLPAR